jgi:serine/threonine protein kinase
MSAPLPVIRPRATIHSSALPKETLNWEISYSELEMGEKIGEGAYGCVYKGKYRETEVAVKQLKQSLSDSDLEEFRQEAQLMKSLRNHTNVVLLVTPRVLCY